jgi:threonine dehydrogenase-like Zn-dependent dehydrogenase
MKTGRCHVHLYMRPLLAQIREGAIDPSFVVTHRMSLDEPPQAYDIFMREQDEASRPCSSPAIERPGARRAAERGPIP